MGWDGDPHPAEAEALGDVAVAAFAFISMQLKPERIIERILTKSPTPLRI
jgi:hypothetical protein